MITNNIRIRKVFNGRQGRWEVTDFSDLLEIVYVEYTDKPSEVDVSDAYDIVGEESPDFEMGKYKVTYKQRHPKHRRFHRFSDAKKYMDKLLEER